MRLRVGPINMCVPPSTPFMQSPALAQKGGYVLHWPELKVEYFGVNSANYFAHSFTLRQTKVPRMGWQTVRTRKSRLKPMNVPPLNLFSPADWYRTILDQVQHEDNLIVQRLSWLIGGTIVAFYRVCCQAAGVS